MDTLLYKLNNQYHSWYLNINYERGFIRVYILHLVRVLKAV